MKAICIQDNHQFWCHWHRPAEELDCSGFWITSIGHSLNKPMYFSAMSPDSLLTVFPSECESKKSQELDIELSILQKDTATIILLPWFEKKIYQLVAELISMSSFLVQCQQLFIGMLPLTHIFIHTLDPYIHPYLAAMGPDAIFIEITQGYIQLSRIDNQYVERGILLRHSAIQPLYNWTKGGKSPVSILNTLQELLQQHYIYFLWIPYNSGPYGNKMAKEATTEEVPVSSNNLEFSDTCFKIKNSNRSYRKFLRLIFGTTGRPHRCPYHQGEYSCPVHHF
ncbi:hypothetical protein TNCT_327651 [Trichonephila clavata]|uniref:Uncharacterized protein n=1 Tax=Trichonephila clavata TaxID=2740835 RepID=A0A8X6GHC4_TRICU|nr:hypothetical protein TNCT_327651 [Trichonephila clavata]